MSEPMVQVHNVTKVYERGKQKIEVLHGLTLDIPRADFVALMGPSGSGKTTLLNLIGGLDQPTSGEISVGGRRIDQLPSGQLAHWRAHNVGFVFQFYNLMPVLSAEGNVELPLLLTSLSKAERRRNRLRHCCGGYSRPRTFRRTRRLFSTKSARTACRSSSSSPPDVPSAPLCFGSASSSPS